MAMIPRQLLQQPALARIAGYGDISPTLGPEDVMSYFNAGSVVSLIKSVGQIGLEAVGAASTVYGAYKGLTGHTTSGTANVNAAGGPTAHPVMTAAGGGGGALTKIEHVMDPLMPGAMFGPKIHARYAPAGTKGYHMIRRGPHAGLWTKNRHRNVCNPRALRRAVSRAHGFARLAMKTIRLVHPHQKGRFGGFRKKGKSR